MASNLLVDHSDEIRVFRQRLSAALSRRIDTLEYEIGRVGRLSLKLPERPVEVIGRIDLTQFNPQKNKKRERLKSKSVATVREISSEQEDKIDLYRRKDIVDIFLAEARAFVDFIKNVSLLSSTLQFAILRKEITDLNCDKSVFTPYTGEIPTLDEMTKFLISSFQFDDQFTREYLTKLSSQHSSILVLSAVCDNLKGRSIDIEKAKSSIISAILSLGNKQVSFSKDLGAYMVSLKNCRFQLFDNYISSARKLDRKSIFESVFPLHDRSELGLNLIYDDKEKSQAGLKDVLKVVMERNQFSQLEYDAIIGTEKTLDSTSGTGSVIKTTPSQTTKSLGYFPFVKPAAKEEDVIDRIADLVVSYRLIEDDPVVKDLFKYRFTGLVKYKPKNHLSAKIIWRINGISKKRKEHPGELFGLLKLLTDDKLTSTEDKINHLTDNAQYISSFFSFGYLVDDSHVELIEYIVPTYIDRYASDSDKLRKSIISDNRLAMLL